MSRLKLMIPGPIELEVEVLKAMGAPNTPHYGDSWTEMYYETIRLLGKIIGTQGRVFVMPGSGSLGLDAAIHSLFPAGKTVLVGNNGFFGLRLIEVLSANGVHTIPVECPPDQPLSPSSFELALKANEGISGIAAVHLETSTGVLNPIQEIAAVAKDYDKFLLVDAISSLGGAEFEMDTWGVDLCVSGSQKALGGAPGLGIVALSDRAWSAIVNRKTPTNSWYLDLRRWQWYVDNWGDWHPHPVTMPTAVMYGLHAALQSLLEQGHTQRLQHYYKLAKRLRTGLAELGLSLFVPEALMAPVLTAAYCPPEVTSSDLVNLLELKHDIKITGGFHQYKDRVIRIGHMGGAISEADIDQLLDAMRQALVELTTI